jgi:uncharacterized damage-inducible protein DinB
MILKEIKQLAAFNRWANQIIFEALSQLPAEHYTRDMHNSHGGIHGTLAHLVRAERGWLSRWLRQPDTAAGAPDASIF